MIIQMVCQLYVDNHHRLPSVQISQLIMTQFNTLRGEQINTLERQRELQKQQELQQHQQQQQQLQQQQQQLEQEQLQRDQQRQERRQQQQQLQREREQFQQEEELLQQPQQQLLLLQQQQQLLLLLHQRQQQQQQQEQLQNQQQQQQLQDRNVRLRAEAEARMVQRLTALENTNVNQRLASLHAAQERARNRNHEQSSLSQLPQQSPLCDIDDGVDVNHDPGVPDFSDDQNDGDSGDGDDSGSPRDPGDWTIGIGDISTDQQVLLNLATLTNPTLPTARRGPPFSLRPTRGRGRGHSE